MRAGPFHRSVATHDVERKGQFGGVGAAHVDGRSEGGVHLAGESLMSRLAEGDLAQRDADDRRDEYGFLPGQVREAGGGEEVLAGRGAQAGGDGQTADAPLEGRVLGEKRGSPVLPATFVVDVGECGRRAPSSGERGTLV